MVQDGRFMALTGHMARRRPMNAGANSDVLGRCAPPASTPLFVRFRAFRTELNPARFCRSAPNSAGAIQGGNPGMHRAFNRTGYTGRRGAP